MPKVANQQAATVAAVKVRLNATIGNMTDQLIALRDDKKALADQIEAIELKYNAIVEQLMTKMDAEGTEKGGGKKGSVSITSVVTGQVDDWDALNAFIKKTGYFHLYQRRLSDPAVRELFDTKGKIPGVSPFTKRKLNLRSST